MRVGRCKFNIGLIQSAPWSRLMIERILKGADEARELWSKSGDVANSHKHWMGIIDPSALLAFAASRPGLFRYNK